MNIDWSKAPEGAIGCGRIGLVSLRVWVGNDWYEYMNEGGRYTFGSRGAYPRESLMEFFDRPTAWNGEGLPPVGVIVRLRTRRSPEDVFGGWGEAEIMYSSKSAVVWRWQGHSQEFGSEWGEVEFEAIRTPEQIAAEEREKAIEEMWKVYWQPDAPTAKQALGLLYDAGYRKQEQTK